MCTFVGVVWAVLFLWRVTWKRGKRIYMNECGIKRRLLQSSLWLGSSQRPVKCFWIKNSIEQHSCFVSWKTFLPEDTKSSKWNYYKEMISALNAFQESGIGEIGGIPFFVLYALRALHMTTIECFRCMLAIVFLCINASISVSASRCAAQSSNLLMFHPNGADLSALFLA